MRIILKRILKKQAVREGIVLYWLMVGISEGFLGTW
jgi:hypothetical protein